jgi:NADH dehydrogenase
MKVMAGIQMPVRPRTVVIGAGFGGLWAVRALAGAPVDVLLLDRNNFHVFLPLLYQVVAAELDPEDIVYPVRGMLRGIPNVTFGMGEVTSVDPSLRIVEASGRSFPYDYLIIAAGSASAFFGVPGAATCALPLKTMGEAIALRNRILACFEKAAQERDPQARRRLLSFVIVGGGATGVEYAGALAELIRGPLAMDHPALDFSEVRVELLESQGGLLPGLPERLRAYALSRLRRIGVLVRLNATVSEVTSREVRLKGGSAIPTETAIWTTGVRGESIVRSPGLPIARGERLAVLPTLQVAGHPEIYAVGDIAYVEEMGSPLPMMAPVAIQQGTAAARNILRSIAGDEPLPFRYRDPGVMVILGRNAAVARIGGRSFTGFPAWVLWLLVHIYKLIGFRNRLVVLINWAWDYFFYERAQRVILP